MEEFIRQKLNSIHEEKERAYLKDLMAGVFLALKDETDRQYRELEKRVEEEIAPSQNQYSIRTGIVGRELYDRDGSLSPLLGEDLEEESYDLEQIKEQLKEGKPVKMLRVFLKCDYARIEEFTGSSHRFQGVIETGTKDIAAEFYLEREMAYEEEMKALYQSFLQNGIRWETVNAPYIHRMYKLMLCGGEELFEGETIKRIRVSFLEYEPWVCYGMVPVWNVEKKKASSNGFPVPCEDHINYEHTVSLKKFGEKDSYLVIDKERCLSFVRRSRENLYLTGPVPEARKWELYQIRQRQDEQEERFSRFTYPILDNCIRGDFAGKLSDGNKTVIRTRAELKRYIEGFGFSDALSFQGGIVTKEKEKAQTYPMDAFLEDELRLPDTEYCLVLTFRDKGTGNFLLRDYLSYLVSQVQRKYPEYCCIGKILDGQEKQEENRT